MYDRTTESWWRQFTGTAIAGTYTGARLKLVAARLDEVDAPSYRQMNCRKVVVDE